MDPSTPRNEIVFLTGKGRSGTTWLAEILATHARCVYKHEPFLADASTGFGRFRSALTAGASDVVLRDTFAGACRECDVRIDAPMPHQRGTRRLPSSWLRPIRGAARRWPALEPVYALAGRPRLRAGDAVLIKDVNFPNELLPRLCSTVDPRLIAIVRNPFANVASLLKGVDLGAFAPPGRADVLRAAELLALPGHEHLARFVDRLGDMPLAAFEALRWRIQVEPLVEFTRRHPSAQLIVYEDFSRAPWTHTQALFQSLGWPIEPHTRAFVESSTAGPLEGLDDRRAFFSVYRSAPESLDKWKTQLALEQQKQIADVVHDSPIRDLWPDLPL